MTEQLLPGETWDGIWDDPRAECSGMGGRESNKRHRRWARSVWGPSQNEYESEYVAIAIKQISAEIHKPAQQKPELYILPQRDDTSGRFVYAKMKK